MNNTFKLPNRPTKSPSHRRDADFGSPHSNSIKSPNGLRSTWSPSYYFLTVWVSRLRILSSRIPRLFSVPLLPRHRPPTCWGIIGAFSTDTIFYSFVAHFISSHSIKLFYFIHFHQNHYFPLHCLGRYKSILQWCTSYRLAIADKPVYGTTFAKIYFKLERKKLMHFQASVFALIQVVDRLWSRYAPCLL